LTVVAYGKAAAGASGALWGLIGSLGVWYFLNRRALDPAALRARARNLLFIVLINVIFTLQVPGVSAEGHFGGGLAGLLAAFPLDFARYHSGWRRYLARAALPLLVLLFFSFFLQRYAAPRYLDVINRAERQARQVYNQIGVKVLNIGRGERRLAPDQKQVLEEVLAQLRSVLRSRWVGSFGDNAYREKVAAGLELTQGWLDFLERIERSACGPEGWSQADEDELFEHRADLIQKVRRWQQLMFPDKNRGG
jgi:hypothetical protein